jgi:hypothetical protein
VNDTTNANAHSIDAVEPHRLSVGDPVLGKTRLLSSECATCIFRPGNPMHLERGRLRQMVHEARTHAGYIICHSTLPHADNSARPAICRGFADRYTTWQLQVIARLWGFVEVEPPGTALDPRQAAPDDPAAPLCQ